MHGRAWRPTHVHALGEERLTELAAGIRATAHRHQPDPALQVAEGR